MGKHRKPSGLPARPTEVTAATDAATGRATLIAALAELRGQIDTLRDRRTELSAGAFDPALAMATAAVGRAVTGAAAQLARLETHDRALVGKMTEEERDRLVHEYLRGTTVERRAAFRVFIDGIDAAEDLLAG